MFNILATHDSDEGENDEVMEDKKIHNNVPDITSNVLKVCNVIREKNYGSKILYKQSGKICGARTGTRSVNEPVIQKRNQQQWSFSERGSLSKGQNWHDYQGNMKKASSPHNTMSKFMPSSIQSSQIQLKNPTATVSTANTNPLASLFNLASSPKPISKTAAISPQLRPATTPNRGEGAPSGKVRETVDI